MRQSLRIRFNQWPAECGKKAASFFTLSVVSRAHSATNPSPASYRMPACPRLFITNHIRPNRLWLDGFYLVLSFKILVFKYKASIFFERPSPVRHSLRRASLLFQFLLFDIFSRSEIRRRSGRARASCRCALSLFQAAPAILHLSFFGRRHFLMT